MSQRAYLRDAEKERFWRGVVQRHAQSGQGVREFCRAERVREGSFYAWRRTLSQRDREGNAKRTPGNGRGKTKRPTKPSRRRAPANRDGLFVPLAVVGEAEQPLEIVAPCSWRVRVPRGFDSEALAEALRIVAAVAADSEGEAERC